MDTDFKLESLTAADIDAVVAIDRRLTDSSRRGFFEKRLTAAIAEPGDFANVACRSGDDLAGFALARMACGEFGRQARSGAIDSMGIDPDARGQGVGLKLIGEVEQVMARKGMTEIVTQVPWGNADLLRFFNSSGFALAPRIVLERDTHERIAMTRAGDEDDPTTGGAGGELDFSASDGDDYQALSHDRIPVRSMALGDLEAIVRIDRKSVGHDRRAYVERKLKEALTQSGIRVSLVAEVEDEPVGFIMARVEFGEFGRTVSVAVLDTIGVNPAHRHNGVGHALMSQLVVNLSILRVETIRTHVAWNGHDLMAYLDHIGFNPAQQISLRRAIA
jgi:predicted N-acetyltransferase YhbS